MKDMSNLLAEIQLHDKIVANKNSVNAVSGENKTA